jgi:hypothetical protein
MSSHLARFALFSIMMLAMVSTDIPLAVDGNKGSNVQIIIVGEAEDEYPEDTGFLFTLHPSGRVSSLGAGGLEYSDERLREFLKRALKGDPATPFRFRLAVEKEKEVSVQLLGKTLQRFRDCADPKASIVIYLILHDVVPHKDKKHPK